MKKHYKGRISYCIPEGTRQNSAALVWIIFIFLKKNDLKAEFNMTYQIFGYSFLSYKYYIAHFDHVWKFYLINILIDLLMKLTVFGR